MAKGRPVEKLKRFLVTLNVVKSIKSGFDGVRRILKHCKFITTFYNNNHEFPTTYKYFVSKYSQQNY